MPTKNKSESFFNESQKLDYIEFEQKNSNHLTRYFKRLSVGEKKYNKDVADMGFSELVDTLSMLNIMRESSRGQMLSLVKGYIVWAQLFGKSQNNSLINSITPSSIGSNAIISSRMLKSPEHLRQILNISYIDNQPNRMIQTHLIFWLLYFGIDIKQLPLLKKSDLNALDNTVVVDTKKYTLDAETVELWGKCSNLTFVERINGKSTAKGKSDAESSDIILMDLIDNDCLFKPIKGSKEGTNHVLSFSPFIAAIKNVCTRYSKKTNTHISLSPHNINNSGRFYRILLKEKSGEKISSELLADEFDISSQDASDLNSMTRKWKIDYEDWKLAFGYVNNT